MKSVVSSFKLVGIFFGLLFVGSISFASSVAIVGGGIAGTTAAILLAKHGVKVDLYEKNPRIFMESSKIPAHLYAGTMYFNLGSDTVKHCMEDAFQFANRLPFAVNPRPTVAAIAVEDEREPKDMIAACEANRSLYVELLSKEKFKPVFGAPEEFCQSFTRKDLERLREVTEISPEVNPWMVSFAKNTQLDSLKYPVLLMQEFGLDMRFAAGYFEELIEEEIERGNLRFYTNSQVLSAKFEEGRVWIQIDDGNKVQSPITRDYSLLVDASGRNLGRLESNLGIAESRYIDVKVAGLLVSNQVRDPQWPMPSTYILGGLGNDPKSNEKYQSFMSQLSPVNASSPDRQSTSSAYIVTITKPDCTYVEGGKISNDGCDSPKLERCSEAKEIIEGERCCRNRIECMKSYLASRHPMAEDFIPVGYFTGSVDILGGKLDARDSSLQIHRNLRFISVNLTKAGAAVRLAEELLSELNQYGRRYYGLDIPSMKVNDPFLPRSIENANRRVLKRFEQDGFPEGTRSTYFEPSLERLDSKS
jgi:hypothetical protein